MGALLQSQVIWQWSLSNLFMCVYPTMESYLKNRPKDGMASGIARIKLANKRIKDDAPYLAGSIGSDSIDLVSNDKSGFDPKRKLTRNKFTPNPIDSCSVMLIHITCWYF